MECRRRRRAAMMHCTKVGAGLLLAASLIANAQPALADTYEVVRRYPHDPTAFTEGLFIRDGRLFESTGLNGHSEIREVRLSNGEVLRRVALPAHVFGEGIVDNGEEIVSLTWTNGVGFRWSRDNFAYLGQFATPYEGWGMTRNADTLFASDGSAQIRRLDPASLAETGRISVTEQGQPVAMLNELEWVDGAILANVWQTSRILRIDPATGKVLGSIDISKLAAEAATSQQDPAGNGIAWDAKARRLYVTGKNWRWMYEIRWLPEKGRVRKQAKTAP